MSTSILIFLVLAFSTFVSFVWRSSRADVLLGRWAEKSGYRILSRRLQYVSLLPFGGVFLGVPFRWSFIRDRFIFRVTAVDGQCKVKSGTSFVGLQRV